MESKLDLELLHTFMVVAETRSLKKTSERVYRSHSGVSMQIKRLEEVAGVKLIERRRNGIEITAEGEKLLRFSREMLRLNDVALGSLRGEEISGKLSIGIPTDYAKNFIRDVIPELKERLPGVQLKIVCRRSRELKRMVEVGSLDAALVTVERPGEAGEHLWSEELLWVSSLGYRYDPERNLPIVVFEDDCLIRDIAREVLKGSGISYEEVLSSPALTNIAEAVQEGLGVSLLPESIYGRFRYRRLPQEVLKGGQRIYINLISNERMDPRLRDILGENIKKAFTLK